MHILLLLLFPFLYQFTPHPRPAYPIGGGSCSISGTFTDCFTYTENPISNSGKWTAGAGNCNGYAAVVSSGAGAFSSGTGCAGLTGFSSSTPSSRFQLDSTASPGVTAICIWETPIINGNGYCYIINLQQIYKISAGSGSTVGTNDCPNTSGHDHDVWELSRDAGNVLRCKDVTTGGVSPTPPTDTTFNVTIGGFLVDAGKKVVAYGWN